MSGRNDGDDSPLVARRAFGTAIRQARLDAGHDLEEVNDSLGWYRGKLSKIETGLLGTKPAEAEALLLRYAVAPAEAKELRELAHQGRRPAKPEKVADSARQYVAYERDSKEIRLIYGEVPGLFQTAEFARAQLLNSPVVAGVKLEGWAKAREQRGERLREKGAAEVWAVLGEAALHYEVGGRVVLRRQLQRLVDLAELPNVHLHVFPFTEGPTSGLSCPFTLLLVERTEEYIAYTEKLTASDYVRQSTEAYRLAFDEALGRSRSEDVTREVIMRRINEME